MSELPPLVLPDWMTVEREYDADHEASVRALVWLMEHPAASAATEPNQPARRESRRQRQARGGGR